MNDPSGQCRDRDTGRIHGKCGTSVPGHPLGNLGMGGMNARVLTPQEAKPLSRGSLVSFSMDTQRMGEGPEKGEVWRAIVPWLWNLPVLQLSFAEKAM